MIFNLMIFLSDVDDVGNDDDEQEGLDGLEESAVGVGEFRTNVLLESILLSFDEEGLF
jgi:hypothetical protein